MRSTLLFLALSAPSVAFAAPTYSSPLHNFTTDSRPAVQQRVRVGFINETLTPCELHVGSKTWSVSPYKTVKLNVVIGSPVRVDSQMNRKLAKTLLEVAATDQDRTVEIR